MTSPKTALYVVGGLVLLMGVWGLVAAFVPSLTFGLPVDPWWHGALKVILGAWAVWVGTQA